MRKIVKIDVDGVIRDMLGALCKLYYLFDPNINRDKIANYSVNVSFPKIKEELGIEAHDYFFKQHVEDVNFNMAVPLPDAKEAIEMLHCSGYKIVIVTKQDSVKSKICTIKFLNLYDIYYDDICFTKDKWLIQSDYMIDDNPEFLTDERERTEKENRLIIDAPYNFKCTYFKRFSTLLDAAEYIIMKEDGKEDNNNDRG